jgi:hypothetical protein
MPTSSSLRVLALLAGVAFVFAELPPGCQDGAHLPATIFDPLKAHLERTPNKFPVYLRLYELEQFVNNATLIKGYGFSPEQTVALGSLFNDGGLFDQLVLDGALTTLGPHVLGLASTDGANLLELSSSMNTRIDILKAIVNVTLDLDSGSELYVKSFTGFLYQEEAKSIIADATPYGCAFGNTTLVKRLAFVIDTSGSMSTTFPGPKGAPVSRLSFVQEQLVSQLENHLDSDQEFNIIRFSTAVTAWAPGVKPVTAANVQSASEYANKLVADGSTNMLAGLQRAMQDPRVEGIYLLTDGAPNGPKQAIIDAVVAWSKGKKPVFPTAFMAGTAGDWMQELAEKTGGTFRKINA